MDQTGLLGYLYEGPLEEPPWQGFLQQLCEVLKLTGASITLSESESQPRSSFVLVVEEGSEIDWQEVESHYYTHHAEDDPVGTERVGPGELRHGTLAELPDEHRDYYRRLGIHFFGRAGFAGAQDSRAWLEFFRCDPSRPLVETELALLRALLPHLGRALRTHQQLMQQRVKLALYEGISRQLALGVLVLDGCGRVLHGNQAVRSLLAEGRVMRLVAGRPWLPDRCRQAEFQQALERLLHCSAAGQEDGSGHALALAEGDRLYGLLARAIQPPEYFKGRHAPHVVLYLVEISRGTGEAGASDEGARLLSRLLGLTPQEARAALLLSGDISLAEVGALLEVTEATARNYSKRIYQKLGLRRRSDLVRVVQRSLALLH